MNITRNNYEEFFILYLDNELSSDDRREVESFVRENSDLKNEFDLLLQTRMTPDDNLVFDGKQQLLKTAIPAPISETNFEEWLLLYIDNELTPKEKIAVEEFVTQNSSAENALKQLQKTKLHPEHAVVFPNKEILYRREKRTPLVTIRVWRRIAVAAALLLAISTAAFFVLNDNNKTNEGQIASEKMPGANSTKNDSSDKRPGETGTTGSEITKTDEASGKEVAPSVNVVADNQKNAGAENEKNKQHYTVSPKQEEKLIAQNNVTSQQTSNLPDTKHNPNANNATEEKPIADLTKEEALTSINDNKPNEGVTPDIASSLNDGKTAESGPDYALGSDDSGKKNKLRGFFRKVTRTFEKRTNIKATDDEDRLLLAGISIKL
jgi:anti-sigma factor RsiW